MNTTTNPAPVDVLAVMRCSAALLRDAIGPVPATANDLLAARAAVAELIEADKRYDETIAEHGISSRWAIEATERRRAALARVSGGAP